MSQSAVRRFLNDAQLHDSVLSSMDSETIKSLQTNADLGDYFGEPLKPLQCEELKKHQQEQEKKTEFAKVIVEDTKRKIELIEIQPKKKAEQLEHEHKEAEEKKHLEQVEQKMWKTKLNKKSLKSKKSVKLKKKGKQRRPKQRLD